MSYLLGYGECCACGKLIQFNPSLVPSIRPFGKGEKQPLCGACFHAWNQIHRVKKGLKPVPLNPNAYGPQSDAWDEEL